MTPGGWILLALSWSCIIIVAAWCLAKVLKRKERL